MCVCVCVCVCVLKRLKMETTQQVCWDHDCWDFPAYLELEAVLSAPGLSS